MAQAVAERDSVDDTGRFDEPDWQRALEHITGQDGLGIRKMGGIPLKVLQGRAEAEGGMRPPDPERRPGDGSMEENETLITDMESLLASVATDTAIAGRVHASSYAIRSAYTEEYPATLETSSERMPGARLPTNMVG